MTLFVPGGPPRFAHQKRALLKMIETGGVTAVLYDPGMGKTATVLDYASLLALKDVTGEARVLVVCPLVAVDTWVSQAQLFVSPQVGFWAEALGGSILERCEALASRGGQPYLNPLTTSRPAPPRGWVRLIDNPHEHAAECLACSWRHVAARASTVDRHWQAHLDVVHPEYRRRVRPLHGPRALHHGLNLAWDARQPDDERWKPYSITQGPDGICTSRVVLEVVNLDTFARRDAYGSGTLADVVLGAVQRFAPHLVVVDESHKIKGARSNASLLLARVGKRVSRRMILTGTVTPAGPLDVFAQWRFLDPYAFGETLPDGTLTEATLEDFKGRYITYGGWDNREIRAYTNLDHMQKVMAKNAVVGRKAEALDLPPTTEVELHVQLSPAEAKAYKEMKDQLVVQLANGAFASVQSRLTQMLRLRQVTSGHLPEDNGPVRVIGSSKAQLIKSLVEDTLAGEQRIVIFALFTQEIQLLTDLLSKAGSNTKIMTIEGSTPVGERLLMRRAFGDVNGHPGRIVMIAQIKTMSLAVNELVTANHAVFASLSQQRDDIEQAKARLDRSGQTRPVTFWYAVAPGTVDEVILKSHRERTSLENALLSHIRDAG
jgi:hypothetical protein